MENENIIANLVGIDELLKYNYIIPIYQREYSWGKDNIYKLLNTIKSEDNVYLGNMLIEQKNENTYRIIDGQQRITTLLLILYYLDSKTYYNYINEKIEIESENESDKLKELLKNKEKIEETKEEIFDITKDKERRKKEDEWRRKNIYLLNFYYISQFLKDIEDKEKILKDIKDKIKFVVITIKNNRAFNISKIFDEINTTGKPLEAKDKFKVRIYNFNSEDGKEIERKYSEINKKENELIKLDENKEKELFMNYEKKSTNKEKNKFIEIDSERYDVEYFLRLYQFFLVVDKRNNKKEYTRELLEMNYETFFDGLFDILNENNVLEIKDYTENSVHSEDEENEEAEGDEEENEENKKLIYENLLENRKKFKTFIEDGHPKDKIIKIEDIRELFDALKDFKEYVMKKENWENNEEAFFSYKLFKKYNRYSWTYRYLPILYFYVFKDQKKESPKKFAQYFNIFIESINKLCAFYTICYQKQRISCKTKLIDITNNLINIKNDILSNKSIEEYTNETKKEIDEIINNQKEDLEKILTSQKDIIENDNRKRVICLILAKKAEEEAEENENNKKYYDRIDQLFSIKFDIEHIYAYNRTKNKEENGLKEEEVNKIGNLMILERSFNESIKDNPINIKINTYLKSEFKVARNIERDYDKDRDFVDNIDKREKNNIKDVMEFFGLEYNEVKKIEE